ncbi:MAG: M42 family metallopeptidase [Candidatus Omnitrophica bacterium]|nr:M42 family metallopeptidase [Candidatus Omnitrophota bacterium]MBU1047661.1 M42 family metallopeptidase [Candidatus Omnitrophota bacterium]MBU1630890.1 M42 family metallopeptidase [Candidatus Omnitrophota bacterium]MBU1888609.1 M42 family metallopeptidase [Candidatus Omnitrophota bacterium]
MRKESLEFLKELVETLSPSGFETAVQKVVANRMKKITKDTSIDVMGNLTGILNKNAKPRIMLAAHCDEIGLMVKFISDEGFIYFTTIGGIDLHLIPGRKVYINTKKGKILGVTGKKAIHLMEKEEREKISKMEDLWIDIGAKGKKQAQELVSIGDPITFIEGMDILKNDFLISRGFDDKMGVYLVTEIMDGLKDKKLSSSVYGVITVQEEVGLRGAIPSTFRVEPDIGICIEVAHATDHPCVDKKKTGEYKIGSGPVISRGANINPKLFNLLIDTAKKEKIPCQILGEPGRTGTDTNVMQLTKEGVATALVSVPLRYMHTPVELLSTKDLDYTARLIIALIKRIKPGMDFTP